ncbi:unnamed protein product [Lupinus luteus]|uniref:DUF4378 domain-containing protein n=1 Tax=Lupinus luteus TaxID=3873 RepID=A0AAV1X7L6_LUPLU
MSKEKDTNHNPSNVVAKLMGLEAFPSEETNLVMERRSIKNDYPQHLYGIHLGSPFNKEMPMLHEFHHASTEHVSHKDIYEMWLRKSPRIRSYVRDKNKETEESELEDVVGGKIALIHQKYMDVKRMSSDERLCRSKRLEDAMEVFCSNSDLLIKLLDEVHCDPAPPTETNNISLLKPLNIVDNDNTGMRNKSGGMIMKPENVDENKNSVYSSSESKEVIDEFPLQCTRIVALKPSCGEINELVFPTTPSSRIFQSGPETLCSSLFSNVGDESSYKKAEHGDLCGAANAYSHESFVYKEAKKRISERWTKMASNIKLVQEQRHMKRNSTLGEMLSLSCSDSSIDEEINIHCSPKTLPTMSCYVTVSSSDDDAGIAHGSKGVTRSKSVKLSLKGKVMSFLLSMNKKPTKEKSTVSRSSEISVSSVNSPELLSDDIFQSFNRFEECSHQSQCGSLRKTSTDFVSNGKQHGRITPKFGLNVSKTMVAGISSETQDQPSPISVLDTPFEDDNIAHDSLDYMKGGHLGSMAPMKNNLIDRSPPIESIARTLSWDNSCSEVTSSYSFKSMISSLNTKIKEQEWLFLVEKLLLASGLDDQVQFNSFNTRWHSLETPLPPSLRDKYAYSFNGKDPLHEAMRRKMRSSQKLVFDCVNATLLELTSDYGSEKYFLKNKKYNAAHIVEDGACSPYLMDHIVAQMKKLIASEMRYDWGNCEDSNRLVVENVVRKEIVGIGWDELMSLEVDILEREIERELIEKLVENAVADFIGRA